MADLAYNMADRDYTIYPSAEQFPWTVVFEELLDTSAFLWNPPLLIFGKAWASGYSNSDSIEVEWEIEQSDLPTDEPYRVIAPIHVKIIKQNELDFIASVEDANISIGGQNRNDAFQALIYEILDLFDCLTAHSSELGPGPERQLTFLSNHLVKAER